MVAGHLAGQEGLRAETQKAPSSTPTGVDASSKHKKEQPLDTGKRCKGAAEIDDQVMTDSGEEARLSSTTAAVEELSLGGLEPDILLTTALAEEMIPRIAIFNAESALGQDTPRLEAVAMLRNLEDVTNWLELVGFRLKRNDHWMVVGLSQEECEGHQVSIEQRIEHARRLIALCSRKLPNEIRCKGSQKFLSKPTS